MAAAFDLLHEGVKRQLYKMGWPSLRPLQVDAIHAAEECDDHLILSAATAAGKTEAAFLPVLSAIAGEPHGSVGAMYVGPLKALINDQFARVEELCQCLDMPVHRWHGDVGAASKQRLAKSPGGVLLITPESLESLFVNRSAALHRILGGLRFVVIDELHAFLATERGTHLRSLLFRLTRFNAAGGPRLIGLSATLGDPQVAIAYLSIGSRPVRVINSPSVTTGETRMRIHTYPTTVMVEDDQLSAPPKDDLRISEDIVRHARGQANLIFANSRDDVEFFGERARRLAEAQSLPDQFMVHHGSLSAEIRVDAEQTMKATSRSNAPATTFCTSTLEMGIDIGSVAMVGQIGAPGSIASFTQRVGRSGRTAGAARVCRMYIRFPVVDERSDFFDRLQVELVQALAASQLMIERWTEPAVRPRFDLSTLTQQVISVIAETGGASAAEIYDRLCSHGAFDEIAPNLFGKLLRRLGELDVLEQTADGLIILGLEGERIRKDKGFYAVFVTTDEFAVVHDGQKIGTVSEPPPPDQHLLLAGRRWRVKDIDEETRVIEVIPASGAKRSSFSGGDVASLHDVLIERMRQILSTDESFPQLDSTGQTVLSHARAFARSSNACRRGLVPLGNNRTAVMLWRGSAVSSVLKALIALHGCDSEDNRVGLDLQAGPEKAHEALQSIAATPVTPDDLRDVYEIRSFRKYDHLLDPELLWIAHRPSEQLVAEAIQLAQELADSGN